MIPFPPGLITPSQGNSLPNIMDGAFYPTDPSDTSFQIDGVTIPASNPGNVLLYTPVGLPAINEYTIGVLFKSTNDSSPNNNNVFDMQWGGSNETIRMFAYDGEYFENFGIYSVFDGGGLNRVEGPCAPFNAWHFLLVTFYANGTALARIDGSSAGLSYTSGTASPTFESSFGITVGRTVSPVGGSVVIWTTPKNSAELDAIWNSTILPS